MSSNIISELIHKMPVEKLRLVHRSFDIIGSKHKAVAVVEICSDLKQYESEIAIAIMKIHKNVKSVIAKESKRMGEFRTRKYRSIAGDSNTEVVHKESSCYFKLDPKYVYFSPRESNERDRISNAVKENEDILIMFSGVGPIPIRIAKMHENVFSTAIELNPIAHNYCVENIYLNKVDNRVKAIQGNVREVCPKLERLYDRIVMPLPKDAHKFLDVAIPLLKNHGMLHFYHWSKQNELFVEANKLILNALNRQGKTGKFTNEIKVSQYSPRVWKICVDVEISHI